MTTDQKILTRPLARYAHTRRVGNLVFIAGQGARDPHTDLYRGLTVDGAGRPTGYDIGEMTRGVIANMERALAAEGLGLGDLVDVTVFLTSMRDFEAMNTIWNEMFEAHTAPTRTTVAVAELPGWNHVEMKGIAAAPRES